MRISDWSSDVCSSDLLCEPAQAAGLDFIRLTTPTTDDKRLPKVLNGSSGFVYYVSVAGVTGAGSATLDPVEQAVRSEETKSELQSLMRISYAVFCLHTTQQQMI